MAGELKLFLGYAATDLKTRIMLEEALVRLMANQEVILGDVRTSSESIRKLAEQFYQLPKHEINQHYYFDVRDVLDRKPDVICLEHCSVLNPEGFLFASRFEDIKACLKAGIDVYATLDISEVSDVQAVIRQNGRIKNQGTVSSEIFEFADHVRFADDQQDLLGVSHKTVSAPFYTAQELSLLRELALRKTTEHHHLSLRYHAQATSILLCILPEDDVNQVIQWTAKYAQTMDVSWTILVLLPEHGDSEPQKKKLHTIEHLAEDMGGVLEIVNNQDIVHALSHYMKYHEISDLVLNRSWDEHGLSWFRRNALLKNLRADNPDITYHIFRSPGPVKRSSGKFKGNASFTLKDSILFALTLLFATLIGIVFHEVHMGEGNILLVYLLGIILIARFTVGYLYSVLASVISVLLFSFFFLEPYRTFYQTFTQYPLVVVVMLLLALVISTLSINHRRQSELALRGEQRAATLYRISKELLRMDGYGMISEYMVGILSSTFQASVILYSDQYQQGLSLLLHEYDGRVFQKAENLAKSKQVRESGKPFTDSQDKVSYFPIIGEQGVLGVVGLYRHQHEFSFDDETFFKAVLSQFAIVFERQHLIEKQHRLQLDGVREKMRNDLLRAISHDLRTPLTSIIGSVQTLLHEEAGFNPENLNLLNNIQADANWLVRMIENVLVITRIQDESFTLHPSLELIDDVLAQVNQRIHIHFPHRKIVINLPDHLVFLPMEPMLIEQVFINLVENAIRHSPEDSVITLSMIDYSDHCEFIVDDEGEGVAEALLETLFDANKMVHLNDMSRGLGIGLSLCNSIVVAHGGQMWVSNKLEGGAQFAFTLPHQEISDGNQ